MNINIIPPDRVHEVVETLHLAFIDYPVMRYVLGHEVEDFEQRHFELVRLFVMARVLTEGPLLGIGEAGRLRAVATVTLPEPVGTPDSLKEYRQRAWQGFGQSAKSRYESFCEACSEFDIEQPHHHLNMLGVRPQWQGAGYGRELVQHVIALAEQHQGSAGVSLSTERQSNVPFYQRLGFELTGNAVVGPGLETWNFFRPR